MIRFQCPTCRKVLKAPDDGTGRKTTCPKCGQRLIVPPPAQPTNQTILGRPLPDPAPAPAPPPASAPDWLSDVATEGKLNVPPPRREPEVSDADRSVLLGLEKDPEPEETPQPSAQADNVLVECPGCRSPLTVPAGLLGRQVVCPNCRAGFSTVAPPPAAPAPVIPQPQPGIFAYGTSSAGFVGQQPGYGPPAGGPPPFGELGEPQDYIRGRKHSGLGIASFLIALLVGGLDVILALVITVGAAGSARHDTRLEGLPAQLVAGGLVMYCLNCMSVPLCLVGAGMGLVGLVAHREHNHLFTWLGLLGNGVVILTVVGLYVLGSVLVK